MNTRYLDHKTQTAVEELQGERYDQEDRFSVNNINGFEWLSDRERQEILRELVEALQDGIREEQVKGGSTLCSVVLCGNRIYTVNVGDSTAFLVVISKEGKVIEFKRLNKIHNMDEPEEREYVKSRGYGNHIGQARGKYVLALEISDKESLSVVLSRAMGDLSFEKRGITHKPDIYVDEVNIPIGGKAIVIDACDGLTEDNCLSEDDIKKIIEKVYGEKKSNFEARLSSLLARAALKMGSQDNISVIVTQVEPDTKQAKYVAIFDGHSGDSASEYLSKHFDRMLHQCIALKFKMTVHEKQRFFELTSYLNHLYRELTKHVSKRILNEIQNTILAQESILEENVDRTKLILENSEHFFKVLSYAQDSAYLNILSRVNLAFSLREKTEGVFSREKKELLNLIEEKAKEILVDYAMGLEKPTSVQEKEQYLDQILSSFVKMKR